MEYVNTEIINTYHIQNIDDNIYPHYYGFINDEGLWYIMRVTLTGEVTYNRVSFQGSGLYTTAWSGRTTLQYTYWSEGF